MLRRISRKFSKLELPQEYEYDYILKNISDIESFQKWCEKDPEFKTVCNNYRSSIARKLLDIYHVNYEDTTNFLYVVNKIDPNDVELNYVWNTNKILKLYIEYYRKIDFNYPGLGFTSFPMFPYLKTCNLSENKLEDFPVQPNMSSCDLGFNQLTSFPVQPELVNLDISNNKLQEFPVQPKMVVCDISNNKLQDFPEQPKMEMFSFTGNPLKHLSLQPKLRTKSIS